MIRLEATEFGFLLEIDDKYGVRSYDIKDYELSEIPSGDTYDGIYALLTEIELICVNHEATPSAYAERMEKRWKEERDEDIARANQGRI